MNIPLLQRALQTVIFSCLHVTQRVAVGLQLVTGWLSANSKPNETTKPWITAIILFVYVEFGCGPITWLYLRIVFCRIISIGVSQSAKQGKTSRIKIHRKCVPTAFPLASVVTSAINSPLWLCLSDSQPSIATSTSITNCESIFGKISYIKSAPIRIRCTCSILRD